MTSRKIGFISLLTHCHAQAHIITQNPWLHTLMLNFNNNLRAAFAPISFCQKITKPKLKARKSFSKHFDTKKLLVKCWRIWHLRLWSHQWRWMNVLFHRTIYDYTVYTQNSILNETRTICIIKRLKMSYWQNSIWRKHLLRYVRPSVPHTRSFSCEKKKQ